MSDNINFSELIITCEACGSVKKFTVTDQSDADKLFKLYACENGCGRNLYSFITLGQLEIEKPIQQFDETTEMLS